MHNTYTTHAQHVQNTCTENKVHERQTARMKTRSEWFLADDSHILDDNPAACDRRPDAATALGFHVAEYRSFDDITQYRNDPDILSFSLSSLYSSVATTFIRFTFITFTQHLHTQHIYIDTNIIDISAY